MLADIFIYVNKQDKNETTETDMSELHSFAMTRDFFVKLDSGFQKMEKYFQNICNSNNLVATNGNKF